MDIYDKFGYKHNWHSLVQKMKVKCLKTNREGLL